MIPNLIKETSSVDKTWKRVLDIFNRSDRAKQILKLTERAFSCGFQELKESEGPYNLPKGVLIHSLQTFLIAEQIFPFKQYIDSLALLSVYHQMGDMGSLVRKKNSSVLRFIKQNFPFELPVHAKSNIIISQYVNLNWPETQSLYLMDCKEISSICVNNILSSCLFAAHMLSYSYVGNSADFKDYFNFYADAKIGSQVDFSDIVDEV